MPGIFKAIGGGNSHACKNLENYLNKHGKVLNDERIGINCDAETFDDDFRIERFKFDIEKKARAYLHYSLSYRSTDNLTHQEILEQAKKLVEQIEKFKGHQIAIICHSDKENHPHVHIVINAVNSHTGKKLNFSPKDLAETKKKLIELDQEKGLGVEVKTRQGYRGQSMKSYKTTEKGENGDKSIWKVAIKNAVINSINKAVNKENFIEIMKKQGFSINWEENKKHITIIDKDGHKRRLSNIEKEYPEFEGKLNKLALEIKFGLNKVLQN